LLKRSRSMSLPGLRVAFTLAALLAVGFGVSAALVHKVAAADSAPSGATAPVETFTGRVVRMDLNAHTFTVRRHDKVIKLNAGSVDLKLVKRGERVIVTYSNGTALKVQATRDIP
jgi:hypothetical protein